MKINFEALKNEFKNYLIEQGLAPEIASQEEFSVASIFEYDDDFIDFVEEKYNVDLETTSLDFSELLDAKFEDGKFVLPEDIKESDVADIEDTQIADTTQATDTTQEVQEFDEANFMLELLNEVISDEEFIQKIDMNGDEILDEEEMEKFLAFANELDEDEEKISFGDIFKGVEKVNNDEYKTIEIPEVEEVPQIEQVSSNSGGGTFINNNINNNNNNNNNKTTQDNTKNYASMNSEKLQAEHDEQLTVIVGKLDEMDSTKDANLANVEEAKKAYDDAIKADNIAPELLTQREENLSAITKADEEIANLTAKITRIEAGIFAFDGTIATLDAKEASLNSALASLSNAPKDDKELQAQIEQKRTEINQQLQQVSTERGQVETAKAEQVELKNAAQLKLDEQKALLSDLETKKSDIDKAILDTCSEDTKLKLEAYNDARKKLDDDMKTSSQNVETAKAELTKIQGFLIKANDREAKKLGYSDKPEIFGETGGYKWDGTGKTENMAYGFVAPNNADSSEELPVIVFLHGSGEVGGGTSVLESTVYNDIFSNYGLENYNGYVLCPSLPSGNWANENVASNIEAVLDDFASTHSISMDNIVIVGHSLGGTGSLYMSQSETFGDSGKYHFKKAAVLTGYPGSPQNPDTPLYVIADSGSSGNLQNVTIGEDDFYDDALVGHGDIDRSEFSERDEDNNNRADMIEWLFDLDD